MFVTRKMDYGLRILLTLGCRPNDRLTSEELAETIEVPRQFTLKIAQSLTKAGIIKAQRGVGGGIQLARDPEKISLNDVFSATDTPRALNDCLIDPAACKHSPFCAPHQTLRGIQNLLDEHLNAITLAELIRNQKILDLKRKQKE
jgi:Rrf2 family transcriptional regulator, iron-sulfur cluster assembly transcription factor